ncbi:MAG: rubredoxin, partial [Mucilaginibacter sp.]
NPNSKDFVVYKNEVHRDKLGNHLIELCSDYYTLLMDSKASQSPETIEAEDNNAAEEVQLVYQCKNCLSIYDKTYGDEANGIAPGTDFETITEYICPVCESSKLNFVQVEKKVTGYKLLSIDL